MNFRNVFSTVCLIFAAQAQMSCGQVYPSDRDPAVPILGFDGRAAAAMYRQQNGANPPTQQVAQAQPPAPQQSDFTVTVGGDLLPMIRGTADFTDGTQLFILIRKPWLPDAQERMARGQPACGDDCAPATTGEDHVFGAIAVVHEGKFVAGPFSFRGQPFKPGRYPLEIFRALDVNNLRSREDILREKERSNTPLFAATIEVPSTRTYRLSSPASGRVQPQPLLGFCHQPSAALSPAQQRQCAQLRVESHAPPAGGGQYQATWKRVEADNGQVYLIDVGSLQSYVRSASSAGILKGVFATIYLYTGPTYDPMNVETVVFECPDYMTVTSPSGAGPSTYLAPRSVGRRLADIACAAPLKRN
jgi:hypothetical protein